MRVSVRLNGQMAAVLGPRRELELAEGARVGDVLVALAGLAGGAAAPGLAVAVDGAVVDLAHPLADGDRVVAECRRRALVAGGGCGPLSARTARTRRRSRSAQ